MPTTPTGFSVGPVLLVTLAIDVRSQRHKAVAIRFVFLCKVCRHITL